MGPHDPGTHVGTTRVGLGPSTAATAFEGAALIVVAKYAIHNGVAGSFLWL